MKILTGLKKKSGHIGTCYFVITGYSEKVDNLLKEKNKSTKPSYS